jgi:polyhydroxyalkanoate synthesis regulator phasin
MLTNVIFYFTLKRYGALKLISWKYSFKRLNEEYEIAKKKKQVLDHLFEAGKISQDTRDSFTGDINAAIMEIEKQRNDLAEKMHTKTQELESQIRTLETLLANYEIQHVVGEIDEEIYKLEINLLATSLETTKNELDVIKQATNQLCPPTQPIQAPIAPEPVAPVIEAETAPIEPTPTEVPVEAAPIEPEIAETAPIEPTPTEVPVETAPVENVPMESAPVETIPVEAPPVEEAPVESVPEETVTIILPEPEVQVINEPTPEITPQEPEIAEPAPQEPIITMEAAAPADQPTVEAPAENATPAEEVAETAPEQPAVEVPLQAFEVTEQAPIETTLEKLMESMIEPATETVIVEEVHVPAHPLEAPHQAPTDATTETESDQIPQTEESEENTTE